MHNSDNDDLDDLLQSDNDDSDDSSLKELLKAPSVDLDDLLAESLENVSLELQAKAARKKIGDTRLNKKEQEEIQATIRRWELVKDWKPAATVAVFHEQVCLNCGYVHSIFSGLFQREVNKKAHGQRWVKPEVPNMKLPKERKEHSEEVDLCWNCAEEFGFPPGADMEEPEAEADENEGQVFHTEEEAFTVDPNQFDLFPEELENALEAQAELAGDDTMTPEEAAEAEMQEAADSIFEQGEL